MDTRTCPGCYRQFPLDYCKSKARPDKVNKKQVSFTCPCGNIPYRTIDKPEIGVVEVTNPVRIVAAKKMISDAAKARVEAEKKLEADLGKAGKVSR